MCLRQMARLKKALGALCDLLDAESSALRADLSKARVHRTRGVHLLVQASSSLKWRFTPPEVRAHTHGSLLFEMHAFARDEQPDTSAPP